MTDYLQTWQRIAILGLNNHNEALSIPDTIAECYPNVETTQPVRRFLDLASLSYAQQQFSALPTQDTYDLLPPLPTETDSRLSEQIATDYTQSMCANPSGFWAILFQAEKTIPDTWLIQALTAATHDRTLCGPLQAVMSPKGCWLARMNPRWSFAIADENPVRWPLSSQLRWLHTVRDDDPELLTTWLNEHWPQSSPIDRAHWLTVAQTLSDTDLSRLSDWKTRERSDKTRRILQRLFACRGINDTARRAAVALTDWLCSTNGQAQITVPETLPQEFIDLGINDQDHLRLNAPKAVLRLGQLLVLAGTEGIAACLQQSVTRSYKQLADSVFAKELGPFLLEAALWSRDEAAINAWCRYYKGKKKSDFQFELMLPGLDRQSVASLLRELSAAKNPLWLEDKVFNWLCLHSVSLDAGSTHFLVRTLPRKRNLYNYGRARGVYAMPSLLADETLTELITELQARPSAHDLLDILLTLLRFRIALADEA